MGFSSTRVATVSHSLEVIGFGLVVGAAVFAALLERDEQITEISRPTSVRREPLLVEPPGGPIIWGITTAQTTITIDGGHYTIEHARGQGMTLQLAVSPRCADADLEVTRLAPAPRLVTRRSVTEPMMMAYVPDGRYELTPVCEHARGATTQLVLGARHATSAATTTAAR